MRVGITASRVLGFVLLAVTAAEAQTPPRGSLRVTVVDPSGAVIPGAQVTVTGIEPATSATAPMPVQTTAQGIAEIPGLVPGRYAIQAEFQGFETRRVPDIRIRAGTNNQVMLLPIEAQKDSVVVSQDRQSAAADPRGTSFGTVLTREQLEALSDDPDTLRQQLQDMAGPGAVIKVDSFEGGALPPKAMIRSIRISRDQFAAENHSAGGTQIEIVTQPGIGPIRFNTAVRTRIDALGGRSPFTPTRGSEQNRNYFANATGTLVPGKASFNVFVFSSDTFETPNINAALGGGQTRAEALRIRSPRDNMGLNANVDYAVTLDQTLRFAFNRNTLDNRNLGIGAFDEEQRAFSSESQNNQLRIQHFGPAGRRAYVRTRLQLGWTDSESRSAFEGVTIRVNDAFTRGGAQVAGGQHSRTFGVGSDVDYVRGINSFRVGLSVDGGTYRANDTSNYLGTYTFPSLDAYLAGQPSSFTRRLGDPNIRYRNLQGAGYFQDDMRVRRNLTLSAGIRYEAQTHVGDFNNLMPRFGVTFAPFADGRTTLRSSWGLFSEWLATPTYEQTLRIDGVHQREIDLRNPLFPDAGDITVGALPVNRYLLSDELDLPTLNRVSVGIDQRLLPKLQSSVTYAYIRGGSVAHGLNLNAPTDGVRPNPAVGNVIEVVSDARSRQHQVALAVTANPGALLPLGARAPLINARRTTLFLNYTWATNRSNTEGAFAVSPTGTLATEWGPASGGSFQNGVFAAADVRHRLNTTLNSQVVKNVLLSLNVNATSAAPYSIRTGADDNGDSIYNDRPLGVARNTERGAAQWSINTQIGYSLGFGRQAGGPPGVAVISSGTAPTIVSINENPKYRVQIFLGVQNLTNHPNYGGYIGTLASPFFGQATTVTGTRKVDLGVTLGF
jgi:hypothetical protein